MWLYRIWILKAIYLFLSHFTFFSAVIIWLPLHDKFQTWPKMNFRLQSFNFRYLLRERCGCNISAECVFSEIMKTNEHKSLDSALQLYARTAAINANGLYLASGSVPTNPLPIGRITILWLFVLFSIYFIHI